MKRFTWLFVCFALLYGYAGVHAQQTSESKLVTGAKDSTVYAAPEFLPANSTEDIDFAVDAAGFKGANGQTYTELYLFLRPSQFTLEEQDNRSYRGKFEIDGVVYDDTGAEVRRFTEQRVYETDRPVLIDRRGQEHALVELLPISLDPGTYSIEITLVDLHSKKIGKCIKPYVAHDFSKEEMTLSDLQLSTHVQVDTTGHRFAKNNILVLPNPLHIFEKWPEGTGMTRTPKMMYFYFEIYNMPMSDGDEPSTYDLSYTIESRTTGMKWALPGPKNVPETGSIGVKVLSLNITSFPADVYGIELTLRDNATGGKATRKTYFEVVQPPPPPEVATVLTKKQAKRGYRMLKVIGSKRDVRLYEKLDLKGKTEFLTNFWKERDPTPDTPENEFMIVFNERFTYADGQLGGVESDRGRIFMKYGQPEEIETHDSDPQLKPYQVWFYTQGVKGDPSRADSHDGRQFFVFGDMFGVGRYRLLHSTVVGEANNPEWINELMVTQPGTSNRDPNAQYGVGGGSIGAPP